MRFLSEGAPRLAIGIGLICVGYTLGSMEIELTAVWAVAVAAGIVAIWLLLLADTHGRHERSSRTAIERSTADDVAREVDRARRSGRPLVFARYQLGGARLAGSRASRDNQLNVIQRTLRTLDRVWIDRDDLFILMPESDRQSAASALTRLQTAFPVLGIPQPVLAVFPDDGPTVGAVMHALGITGRRDKTHTTGSNLSTPKAVGQVAEELKSATGVVDYTPEDAKR